MQTGRSPLLTQPPASDWMRDRDTHVKLILGAASAVLYEWDVDRDRVIRLSSSEPGLPATTGMPGRFEEVVAQVHADDRVLFRENVQAAIRTGSYRSEHRIVRPDGTVVWLHERGLVERDAAGNSPRLLGISFDITERKRIEQQLVEQQRLYKTVTDNATTALFIMDEHQHCVFMNPAAERLTGFTMDETRGRSLHDVLHHTRPDGRPYPLSECPIDQAFPKNDREQGEEVFVHKDGHFYHVAFTASPVKDQDGRPRGTVIEVEDIRQRKQREEQVLLLMREVNHRAKNMLAVVQSIARQTTATSPTGFVRRFSERIQALAANQDLLIGNDWRGVQAERLVRAQLAPFVDLIGDRIDIHGPEVQFNPAAAQVIGLALHELATNSAKHGALSNASGRVLISWRIFGDRFEFGWVERGGPPVEPPTHKGFGTVVLTRLAKITVYGEAELCYAREGLSWILSCMTNKVVEQAGVGLARPGQEGVP